MSQVSLPYAPGQSIVWTTYTYDGTGRTVSVRQGDGSTTSYSYAANTITETDPAGKWKTFATDAFGNLTTVTEPDPANQPSGTVLTSYTYNNANQLTQVSMPRNGQNQTRSFTWSGTDLAGATNPENGTVSYQYDGAHHVTLRTDAKGQQTQYSYDRYGRLTQTRHFTSSSPFSQSDQIDYYYDSNPIEPSFSSNSWGRLTAVSWGQPNYSWNLSDSSNPHPAMWYEYSYNPAGRVTNQRMGFPLYASPGGSSSYVATQDLNASYAWDNRGRMTSMTGPDGNSYQYQYDPMSNLGTMQSWNPNCGCWSPLATASYNWTGERTSLSYSSFTESRTYNSLLQLTRLQNYGLDMQYLYQAGQNNGRIVQSIDSVRGETVNYAYDVLNRLTSAEEASGKWGNAFSYDGWGTMNGKTYTPGQAATPGTVALPSPRDANGNYVAGWSGSPYYQYDVENRMLNGGVWTPGNVWCRRTAYGCRRTGWDR